MRISRHEARKKLADAMVTRIGLSKRAAILSEWWTLDCDDEEWSDLPAGLQRELEVVGEAPRDASPRKYDPLIRVALLRETLGVRTSWLQAQLRQVGDAVEVLGEPERMADCRCCGSLSIHERGVYEICPVCFWEDDGLQDLDTVSGPNHMTLREGKKNYERIGACSEESLRFVAADARAKFVQSDR